jgi:hypothetical protein
MSRAWSRCELDLDANGHPFAKTTFGDTPRSSALTGAGQIRCRAGL